MYKADYQRVTHPSATNRKEQAPIGSFDLHVLSTPPAFILSQDQTLIFKVFVTRIFITDVILIAFALKFISCKELFHVLFLQLLFCFQSSICYFVSALALSSDDFYNTTTLFVTCQHLFTNFLFSYLFVNSCFFCNRTYNTTIKINMSRLFDKILIYLPIPLV